MPMNTTNIGKLKQMLMNKEEKTVYTSPVMEMVELENEQGFAVSFSGGGTSPFENDGEGSWN